MLDTHSFSESTDIAREVARRMLGQNASVDDVSAHRLACDLLRQQAFCPQMDRRQAIVTLSSPLSLIDAPDFSEQIAAKRLDEFARHFFSLPITERRLQWCLLSKQLVRMPQLHWRLRNLEQGLEVDEKPVSSNSPAEQLAHQVCEMFVLPPQDASRMLWSICLSAEMTDRGSGLGDSIHDLHQSFPAIASLNPATLLPAELLLVRRELKEAFAASAPIEHWRPLRQMLKASLGLLAILFSFVFIVGVMVGPKAPRPEENDLSPYEKSQIEKYGFHVDEIKRPPTRKDDGDLTDEEKEASARFLESLKRLDPRKNRALQTRENEGVERLEDQESEQADE